MLLQRLSRRGAPLALGLALWTALPSLEWCPFSWAECRASCDAAQQIACATAQSCETARRGSTCAASPDACATPSDACPASSDACAATTAGCPLPCDPSADPVPLGDRAWCVHPPIDALVASSIHIEPPVDAPVLATLATPVDVPPPVATAPRAITTVCLSPVLISPHAPPLGRAPPALESGTRC